MNIEEKISIIIPSFNSEKYITESIKSVINQTYKNIEIIVIDDGSTDNTKKLLKEYIDQKKIIYIKKENGGPASARNIGIEYANGEYIALLDADDTWNKNKLEKQIIFLKKYNFDLVYTDRFFIGSTNLAEWISNKKNNLKSLIKENYIVNSSVLIRSNILKKEKFNENKNYFAVEDYDLWLKLSFKKYKFGHLAEKLTGYRIHSQQISSKKDNLTNLINIYKNNISKTNNYYYKLLLIYMYIRMNLYKIKLKYK